ncbi:MAG: 50S ribosomal protein L30 [Runella slithyformis]|jgi:large subunit ribosomal protein L30|nr:MAG: 50S ribosomal protein L30 [Runella slithyformis]TAF98135.1 MAG: 50S ribosomal protein L30 [Runella sp.]TAG22605.1 MAG: 50S ribosomal protein L30 [Cytophagales bacterium]TAG41690.1 MAG: 50S ribosomal protein L30 [Cytophagia bacterium]TAE94331.1 MAG: 50S ribosomal protein L30 [Runella slithyformis]
MSKVKVTQVRSMINRPERQKRTLKALGLGKINRSIEVESNPTLMGMVNSVSHLLKIEDI